MSSGMQVIDVATMKEIVKLTVIGLNEPCMFVGGFGVGKTGGLAQVVEEVDAYLCDIRLGQYDSVDLRGFPGVHRDTGLTVWHAPSTMPFIGNPAFPKDKIILLALDEITSATPPVATVAYQLVNERKIGEHVLMDNVRLCAMGNREIDKGVVNRMPMPLANRMTWFEVAVSVEAWCNWAQTVGIPPIFIAFMNFRKPLLCTYDPDKPAKVVATPRTWEKAAKYYVSDLPQKIKEACIIGAIGEGPALEFGGFINVWQKVLSISKIIADPEGVPLPEKEDIKYATAVNVSGSMDIKNVEKLHKFLFRLAPEYSVLAWQLATKRSKALLTSKEFVAFAAKYRQVFQP